MLPHASRALSILLFSGLVVVAVPVFRARPAPEDGRSRPRPERRGDARDPSAPDAPEARPPRPALQTAERLARLGDREGAVALLRTTIASPAAGLDGRNRRCRAIRALPFAAGPEDPLAGSTVVLLTELALGDRDPWGRAAALSALAGLDWTSAQSERSRPLLDLAEKPGAPDFLEHSYRDRIRGNAGLAQALLAELQEQPPPPVRDAILLSALAMDPMSGTLEILKLEAVSGTDAAFRARAVEGLARFPSADAAAPLQLASESPERLVAAAAVRAAADLKLDGDAWAPAVRRLLGEPPPAGTDEDDLDHRLVRSEAALAATRFWKEKSSSACAAILGEALAPGAPSSALLPVVRSLESEGVRDFVPDLYLALERCADFPTRDAVARALTILDPAYDGPPSLGLRIDRLRDRLAAPGANRPALEFEIRALEAEYQARSDPR